MDMLKLDQFSTSLGEIFELSAGGGMVPLRLEKAEPLSWSNARGDHGFRLEWSGPLDQPLAQGTYAVRLGERDLEIFIVPIAKRENDMRYEAIFN